MAFTNLINPGEAESKLTRWLGARMPDAANVVVTDASLPAASGFSAETVIFAATWTDDQGVGHRDRMVARVKPTGDALFTCYDFDLEHRLLDALAEHSTVPVPKVLFNEDDAGVLGAPFIVLEFLDGRVAVDDPPYTTEGWVHDLSPAERALLVDNSLQAMAAVHATDWRGAGLEFMEKRSADEIDMHAPGLDAQITTYRSYFDWARDGKDYPFIDTAFAWLRTHQPEDVTDPVLTWGDARIGNILFGADHAVAGVLDWEMAALGSPEMDLGYWLTLAAYFTDCIRVPTPEGFPTRAETIRRYEELSGHSVRDLEFYEVFAAVKLAVFMVRMAALLIGAGSIPSTSRLATNNVVNSVISRITGIPEPEGADDTWIGRR
jgi:aminoglycoside phosphotransferase (APT) family kinase protein